MGPVLRLLVVLPLITIAAAQNGLSCPFNSKPCPISNTNQTFQLSLPNNETYTSFYNWITLPSVLGSESSRVSQQWIDQNRTSPNIYFNDKPEARCFVNVSFVNEFGSFRSRLGAYQFLRDAPLGQRVIASTIQNVFEDASSNITPLGIPCLAMGATTTLGPFPGNSSVGFFLDQNYQCVNPSLRLWTLDDENKKYDMSNWNPTAKAYGRTTAVLRDPTTGRTFFGFEDIVAGGDQDYNDVIIYITYNCSVDTSMWPCYSTCRYPAQVFNPTTCSCACPNSDAEAACVGSTVGWDSTVCACVPTPSATPSRSVSPTISRTPSSTPSVTPSRSLSPTPTPSATPTPSPTSTHSPSASVTPSTSSLPSLSPSLSPTPSMTSTNSPSSSPSCTLTSSPSLTITPSLSATPSVTCSLTPSPSNTPSPSLSTTCTPSSSSTPSTSPSASPTATSTTPENPSTSRTASPSLSRSPSPSSSTLSSPSSSTWTPTTSPSSSLPPSPSSTTIPIIWQSSLTPSPSISPSSTVSALPTPITSISLTQSSSPYISPLGTPSSSHPAQSPSESPTSSSSAAWLTVSPSPTTLIHVPSAAASVLRSPSIGVTKSTSSGETPSLGVVLGIVGPLVLLMCTGAAALLVLLFRRRKEKTHERPAAVGDESDVRPPPGSTLSFGMAPLGGDGVMSNTMKSTHGIMDNNPLFFWYNDDSIRLSARHTYDPSSDLL